MRYSLHAVSQRTMLLSLNVWNCLPNSLLLGVLKCNVLSCTLATFDFSYISKFKDLGAFVSDIVKWRKRVKIFPINLKKHPNQLMHLLCKMYFCYSTWANITVKKSIFKALSCMYYALEKRYLCFLEKWRVSCIEIFFSSLFFFFLTFKVLQKI